MQNIYYTTRDAFGKQFNYRAFWQKIAAQGDIVVANAYATDGGNEGQAKFQRALSHIGFNVKLKPYIQRSDGSAKGDWDVGITIDVLEAAANLDLVILLSGDGDFDLLLEKVADNHQVETHVYGVPNLTAVSLKAACNYFHEIESSLLL